MPAAFFAAGFFAAGLVSVFASALGFAAAFGFAVSFASSALVAVSALGAVAFLAAAVPSRPALAQAKLPVRTRFVKREEI